MRTILKLRAALHEFARAETSGAILLLIATVIALLWANFGGATYLEVWHSYATISLGDWEISMSLQHWINDGLMMLFFFLVSLEVKHDFVMGELRQWRRASVPVIAALAGLAVPALLFLSLNAATPGANAWGIVISTDTAFVMGMLAVFGKRLPVQLRAFLVTLAVVDDVGALLVIATVYTDNIQVVPVVVAAVIALLLWLIHSFRIHRTEVYVVAGVALWLAFLASGVHATIAGVVLGLLLPVFPPERREVLRAEEMTQVFRRTPVARTGHDAVDAIRRAVSLNERIYLRLTPVVNLMIVPVFALANAGVVITGETLAHAFTSPMTWGIILGLVAGKAIGISAATFAAMKLKLGELAPGLGVRHVASGSVLTGIGFTISLFIVDLAISDPVLQSDARIGVLTASLIAAILGMAALSATARYDAAHRPARKRLSRPVDPARDHVQGCVSAPLTLVEYGRMGGLDDAAVDEVVRQVLDHFDTDLRFVFRHNPMDDPAAHQAAEAIEAVNAQSPDLFAPMRTELGRLCQTEELDARLIRRAAVDVGANLAKLDYAIRHGEHATHVHDDADDAANLGLDTSPVFFINDDIYDGPAEAEALIAAIEAVRDAATQFAGEPS